MVITDAQVHLWEAHRPDRPWLPEDVGHTVIIAGEGARPHREKPFEAAEMTELMDARACRVRSLCRPRWWAAKI